MPGYVIIGDGPAGISAAQGIRWGDAEATITVLSADPSPYYYRAALTNYLLGQLRDDELWGVPPDFYARHRIGRYYGQVVGIDGARNVVALDSGREIPYDALLIASGASPTTLPVPGAALPGVMTFRTLQDARRIVDLLPDLRQAVIVGGGTLGLEWTQGLRHKGIEVTYLLRERHFMARLLDADASELVLQRLRASGVNLVLHDEVAAVEESQGWAAQVHTKAGRRIPCQLVGTAIGVRPNIAFLGGSGLELDQGVVVDAELRTTLPNVFAAGDVAQVGGGRGHRPPPSGLWQPARMQGRLAGRNMVAATGRGGTASYQPGAPYVATHLYDLDFAAVGETQPRDTARLDTALVRTEKLYRKLLLRDGRLIGALLIGDRRTARTLKRLIDLGIELSPVRARLLDEHFDLARWAGQQIAARAPQRISLTGPHAAPPGAGTTTGASLGLGDLAVDATIAVVPAPTAPGGARRPAQLLLDGRAFPVSAERATTIGRAQDCDIVLADGSVSRRHAELLPGPDGYALRDLGSGNGSWVGLARVSREHPQAVQAGDILRLGAVALTFALGQPTTDAPPAGGGVARLSGPAGELVLTKEITSLGRSPDNDVVVGDRQASRLHAQIVRTAEGDLYLRDLGSVNGTTVNGARVFDAHRLLDGDTIGIGAATYTFRQATGGAEVGPPPAGELTIVQGDGAGTRHPLRPGETTIGRDQVNAIALADPLVTRRHAVVAVIGGAIELRDLGSSNGTWVNNARLTTPRALQEGDTIDIGQTRFVFRRGGGGGAVAAGSGGAVAMGPVGADEPTRLLDPATLRVSPPRPAGFALEIVAGPGTGGRFALAPATSATIGREAQNAIQLRDSQASRRHAEVRADAGGRVTVRDLGSRNGTLVNGRPIADAVPLREGDDVRIGDTTLRLVAQ